MKNQATHTPGEWKIVKHSSFNLFDSTDTHTIAIELSNGEKIALLGGNQEANARLIAAAPELLKALKEEHDFAYEQHANYQGVEHDEKTCEVCQLIAKAEGKTI